VSRHLTLLRLFHTRDHSTCGNLYVFNSSSTQSTRVGVSPIVSTALSPLLPARTSSSISSQRNCQTPCSCRTKFLRPVTQAIVVPSAAATAAATRLVGQATNGVLTNLWIPCFTQRKATAGPCHTVPIISSCSRLSHTCKYCNMNRPCMSWWPQNLGPLAAITKLFPQLAHTHIYLPPA
jgi:hypothetical protein